MNELAVRKIPNRRWPNSPDYVVVCGNRFYSQLTFDEALGWLARWMLKGEECYGGLRTYEQWVGDKYSGSVPPDQIAGLLTHTPLDCPIEEQQTVFVAEFLFNPRLPIAIGWRSMNRLPSGDIATWWDMFFKFRNRNQESAPPQWLT